VPAEAGDSVCQVAYEGDASAVEAAEPGAYATSRVLVPASPDIGTVALVEMGEPQAVELPARHRHREAGAVDRVLEREEDALPAVAAHLVSDQ